MIHFDDCYADLLGTRLAPWLETLPAQMADWNKQQYGDLSRWQKAVLKLPVSRPEQLTLELADKMAIHTTELEHDAKQKQVEGLLQMLHPWRKGPYFINDIHIDTEWRSDWKWQRVAPHISSLDKRVVLDVGCGNGYHMWRMLGAGAKMAIGIDPAPLFLMQFRAIHRLAGQPHNIHLLPLGVEQMQPLGCFDTVFSMGVLYHRRSPIDHLLQLFELLRPGGELVLETLVVEGDENQVLVPGERYAKMRNVWFLPSAAALCHWLSRCGFNHIRVVDKDYTSVAEQRSTEWMRNESLADYLTADKKETIEGYPPPLRTVIVAEKPF